MISEFFNYSVAWWVWGIPASAALISLFVFLSRTIGLRNAILVTVSLGSVLLIRLSEQKGRQTGWNERKKREIETSKKAKETIEDAFNRANNSINAHPERLRESDGHRRLD